MARHVAVGGDRLLFGLSAGPRKKYLVYLLLLLLLLLLPHEKRRLESRRHA
jgi:hypothetical protein